MESILTKSQKKTFGPKRIKYGGEDAFITAEVRYDAECGNGHNSFAITAYINKANKRTANNVDVRERDMLAGGCLHDEISKHFPQLAHLIKWHLTSSDGPMHYLANTLYMAGEKDCRGYRAEEACSWDKVVRFVGFPIEWQPRNCGGFMRWLETVQGFDFEVLRIDHSKDHYKFGPKYTLGGAPDKWHECPFDTEREGLQFLDAMRGGYAVVEIPTQYSEGKERELDAARNAAVWPEATDKQLTAPGLKERLEARLPQLLADFKRDIESLGFTY